LGSPRYRRGAGAVVRVKAWQPAPHPHDVSKEGTRVARPLIRVARGRTLHQGVESGRNAANERRRRWNVFVRVPVRDRYRCLALVRRPTRQHFEQHDARGVHIAARIGNTTKHLLR